MHDTEWRCLKCEQLKSKNGGWTNLLSHLTPCCVGKDYALQFVEHADAARMQQQEHAALVGAGDASAGTMNSFILCLSDAEKEMTEWISCLLVMKNQPISLVDWLATRKLARLKPVGSKSLRKHVLSLMTVVKEYIKQRLPSTFGLVFDGSTEGTDHYIAW